MSKSEAHALLDAAREGADVPGAVIARALRATGDLGGRRIQPQARPAPGPFDWLLPSAWLQ